MFLPFLTSLYPLPDRYSLHPSPLKSVFSVLWAWTLLSLSSGPIFAQSHVYLNAKYQSHHSCFLIVYGTPFTRSLTMIFKTSQCVDITHQSYIAPLCLHPSDFVEMPSLICAGQNPSCYAHLTSSFSVNLSCSTPKQRQLHSLNPVTL